MSKVADIYVNVGASISDFQKQMNAVQRTLKKSLGSEAMSVSKTVAASFAGMGAGFAALGVKAVKSAADMEMTRTAFTQMLGSAQKAESFIKDLQKFAADTPFGFEQVKGASQKFLAFGFTAEQVIPILTSVGNAAAGLGMKQDGIDRLTLALGQMAAKGKVSGEEMRQLAEAGIPAWDMLAQKMGVSIPEAMDQVSKGGVSAAVGLDALVSGMDQRFAGMMDKMSGTLSGLWATLEDNADMALIALGESISENLNLKGLLKDLGDTMTEFTATLQSSGLQAALKTLIPPEMETAIYGIATALTVAAIPAVVNFGASLAASAAGGLIAFRGGIATIIGIIPGLSGALTTAAVTIRGMGALAVATTHNLSGLPRVIAMVRTAFTLLYASMGPVGLAIAAIGLAISAFVATGGSVTQIFSKMGVSSSALEWSFKNLKNALSATWEGLKNLFSIVVKILSPLVALAALIGSVLLHALAGIVAIIGVWVNVLTLAYTKLGDLLNALGAGAATALSNFGSWLDGLTGGALGGFIDKVASGINALREFLGLASQVEGAASGLSNASGALSALAEAAQKIEPSKELDFSQFGGGGTTSKKGKTGKDLAKEAASVSKEIEKKWYELFSTRSAMIDRWFKEEKEKLDRSKSVNANYAQDLVRLTEVAEEKKRQAILETQRQQMDIVRGIEDMMKEGSRAFDLSQMSAGQKLEFQIELNYQDKFEALGRKYEDLFSRFQELTKEDQEFYLKALDERGVAYEKLADGSITFEREKSKELIALENETQKARTEAYVQNKALQADIEEAFNLNSLTRLQELLTAESAMRLNDYAAQQEMMTTYQEAFLAAHATTAQLVSSLYSSAFSGLSENISAVFQGTKSASEAFKELGKTMLKVVADFIAKKIAGMVLMTAMGRANQSAAVAQALATGKATEAAYAKAAYYASVMSFGSAAATGAVALVAGFAASQAGMQGMDVPFLASGGITTGPALALIGEGRFDETVLPLNSRVISPIMAEAMELYRDPSAGDTVVTLTNYGDFNDGTDLDSFLGRVGDAVLNARRGR